MRRTALLILGLVLALPSPAGAVGGPVVATDGGLALHARRDGSQLCLRVTGAAARESYPDCGRPPRSPYAPRAISTFGGGSPAAIAVAPAVATVELETRAGRTRYPTVAADGFKARFLLVAAPGRILLARFFDATGTLIGAATIGYAGQVVPGSRYDISTHALVFTEPALAPTPLEPDRIITSTCMRVHAAHSSSSGGCLGRRGHGIVTTILDGCAPRSAYLAGLADQRVRAVRIVLGSGRTLTMNTRELPARFGVRAFARPLPRGEAVRRAIGYGASAHRVAREAIAQQPTGLRCDAAGDVDSGFGILFPTTGHGPIASPSVVAELDGHRLLAADGRGQKLCSGLDELNGLDCALPPVDGTFLSLQRHGTVVGGVVSADTARVELRLDDGSRIQADTLPAGYAGRFSGTVRYALVAVPAERKIVRAVPRTADGSRLGIGAVRSPSRSVTLRRGRAGGLRYRLRRDTTGTDLETCLEIDGVVGGFPTCSGSAALNVVSIDASCRPRRLVVFGILAPSVRRVTTVLADGSERPTGIARGGGTRAWLTRLPRRAHVTALHFYGRLPRPDPHSPRPRNVQSLELLPVADQCGYSGLAFALQTGRYRAMMSRSPVSYSSRLRRSPLR